MQEETTPNSGSGPTFASDIDSPPTDFDLGSVVDKTLSSTPGSAFRTEEEEETPDVPVEPGEGQLDPNSVEVDEFGNVKSKGRPVGAAADVKVRDIVQPTQRKPRDLTGIPEEFHPEFKAMSNSAFQLAKNMFMERAKLQEENTKLNEQLGQIQDAKWYQTENAWTLHPDYQAAQTNLDNLRVEENWWTEQLAALREGKPAYMLTKDASGNYAVGTEMPAGSGSEAKIIQLLSSAQQYQGRVQEKIAGLQGSFKGQFESVNKTLAEIDQRYFGKVDAKKIEPGMKEAISWFPLHMQKDPLVQMMGKSWSVIKLLVDKINSMEQTTKKVAAVKTAVKSQGPSPQVAGAKGSSTDEWNRFKQLTGE